MKLQQSRAEKSLNGRKSPAASIHARPRPVRRQVRPALTLMRVIRFHIPNDDYDDDDEPHHLRVRVNE